MDTQNARDLPTLDTSELESLAALQGDAPGDLVADMIALFCEEGTRRIADARAALAANNPSDLRRAAHSLRGACGVVGATRLSTLSGRLEAEADQPHDGMADMISGMAREFEAVQALLRSYLVRTEKRTA